MRYPSPKHPSSLSFGLRGERFVDVAFPLGAEPRPDEIEVVEERLESAIAA